MAPKPDKKAEKGQQKAVEKQKAKIAEDKTFGLKNKNKSKAVQKFIKGIHNAAKGQQNVSDQVLRQKELEQKEEKKKQLQQAALMSSLFKGTENIKKISESTAKRTDPKSIKADQVIDLYTDQRDQRHDTMENWDMEKLQEVIRTKHGSNEVKPTEIVCKYFLDALEKRQYGWFWSCPNGGDICKYRHCLPPGYVLKREMISEDIDNYEDEEPIEDIIERERVALPPGGTKVTLETFLNWKAKKEKERKELIEEARIAETKKTGGTGLHLLSGKDLFSYDPELFIDDAAAASEDDYQEDDEYWKNIINENQATLDAANLIANSESSKQIFINEEKIFLDEENVNIDEVDF